MTGAPTITPAETPPDTRPPALSPRATLWWAWRQLTSMRTALMLLFLLALAAVPGSFLPQENVNPGEVAKFRRDHPGLGPWLDRLSLFDVFGSPWFAAIYLLLLVSLVGCVLPRLARHLRALRAGPPPAPRRLDRLPFARRWASDADPVAVVAAAAADLRSRRYRVRVSPDGTSVAAEKGYLRETGNLLFHLSLLVLLAGVAVGSLFGYRGNALVVAGNGDVFSNTLTRYDEFTPGRLFNSDDLPPFSFTVDRFDVRFEEHGDQRGAAREFEALLTYRRTPEADEEQHRLRVNHPLEVDGSKVYLTNHGYAPRFTVRDGSGQVAFQDSVPFLPEGANLTSRGVVKAPDASPEQLGFSGLFFPTGELRSGVGWVSTFPDARDPVVVLTAYKGDLGLDSGIPQSVYSLDTDRLEQFTKDGQPLATALRPGETMTLPDGQGSITFDGYDRWIAVQVSRDPGSGLAMGSAAVALGGLMLSLFVRPRRVWVRAVTGDDGYSVVDVAGLARREGGDVTGEVDATVAGLQDTAPAVAEPTREE